MFLSTAPQSLKWLPRQYNKVIFGFVCVPQVADVKSKMAPKLGGDTRVAKSWIPWSSELAEARSKPSFYLSFLREF